MLFDHPNICVSKLRGDDSEGHIFHSEPGRVGVPEAMKGDRRDFGSNTCCCHRALLVRC